MAIIETGNSLEGDYKKKILNVRSPELDRGRPFKGCSDVQSQTILFPLGGRKQQMIKIGQHGLERRLCRDPSPENKKLKSPHFPWWKTSQEVWEPNGGNSVWGVKRQEGVKDLQASILQHCWEKGQSLNGEGKEPGNIVGQRTEDRVSWSLRQVSLDG